MTAAAQSPKPASDSGAGARCLVIPFRNRSGDTNLGWMGESFVVAFRRALRGAGLMVLTRADRLRARAILGAPEGVDLSHASLMRLAQDADARWLVLGSFDYDGEQLSATAALVDLQREHLVDLAPVKGPLRSLQALEATLGWSLRQQVDPVAVTLPKPAPDPAMPISAYEDFVRSGLATKPSDQVQLLRVAEQLAPNDDRILLALGQAYFRAVMDAPAASELEKIPASSPDYPQAAFTAGLAEYGLGHYAKAMQQWQEVEKTLPLPAVVHNLAITKAAAQGNPHPGALETEFPAEEFLQLQHVVTRFDANKLAGMSASEQVRYELQTGERLLDQGGWAAAADAFQKVIALAAAGAAPQPQALGTAHAGLAAIWYARHDSVRAAKEAAAALAADPKNAQAQQLEQKLKVSGQGPGARGQKPNR